MILLMLRKCKRWQCNKYNNFVVENIRPNY